MADHRGPLVAIGFLSTACCFLALAPAPSPEEYCKNLSGDALKKKVQAIVLGGGGNGEAFARYVISHKDSTCARLLEKQFSQIPEMTAGRFPYLQMAVQVQSPGALAALDRALAHNPSVDLLEILEKKAPATLSSLLEGRATHLARDLEKHALGSQPLKPLKTSFPLFVDKYFSMVSKDKTIKIQTLNTLNTIYGRSPTAERVLYGDSFKKVVQAHTHTWFQSFYNQPADVQIKLLAGIQNLSSPDVVHGLMAVGQNPALDLRVQSLANQNLDLIAFKKSGP